MSIYIDTWNYDIAIIIISIHRPYQKLVLNTKIKQKDAIDYVREVLKYRGEENILEQFNQWEIPRFPINGKILKEHNVPPGNTYGIIMNKLKEIWIENDYKQTTDDLVKFIPDIVKEFAKQKKIKKEN